VTLEEAMHMPYSMYYIICLLDWFVNLWQQKVYVTCFCGGIKCVWNNLERYSRGITYASPIDAL